MKLGATLTLLWLAAGPVAAQTSLTIYNDGRVLVRRTTTVAVPRGASTQRISLGTFDPATVFPLDSGITFLGVSYDAAVDEASTLRRAVGKRLVFQHDNPRDTSSALVLAADPLRLQLPDGRVSFQAPGIPLYPADLVALAPTAMLSLRSTRAWDRLRLGYFTGGAAWQASYQVLLGGTTARVSGQAVLSSESLDLQDAEVQLLAGAVNRAAPAPMPMYRARAIEGRVMTQDVAGEQQIGDYHIYTLPGKLTLTPGLTTSVALFEPAQVPYERHYVVRGLIPYYGAIPPQGDEQEAPVEITYTLKRPRKTEFGDRPLPGGVVRLFQPDSAGRLQLVGEAGTGHIAPGNDLRLNAGIAFDLTAQRVQTTYTTRRDSTAGRWRTLATADYRVTLRNATDTAVTIDVLEERGGEWRVLSSSVPAEKLSATTTRFRVPVPANHETVLTYRIQAVW